jgi:hypothetical protein
MYLCIVLFVILYRSIVPLISGFVGLCAKYCLEERFKKDFPQNAYMDNDNYNTAQRRRFLLLGFTISLMILFTMYLLDLFSIKSLSNEGIVLLFAGAVISLLVTDSAIERFKLSNPFYIIIPATVVLFASFIIGFRIAIAFSLMLCIPAIIVAIRWIVGEKTK